MQTLQYELGDNVHLLSAVKEPDGSGVEGDF